VNLRDQLFDAILKARQRVYAVGERTPLERIELKGGGTVHLKREDLSPIHSYKWRGAYNRMAMLTDEECARGVVAASAGNHAQGVALAARRLGVQARIYMPQSTPRMKRAAVARHGGEHVEVVLHGDQYSDAADRALADLAQTGGTYIHAYDDLGTMGGQGTLADEIVLSGQGPFDTAYLQVGGGGMAAAVACWLKAHYPGIRIVGVEGVDQACMHAAIREGRPVSLEYVDVFCDGTAVREAGAQTYPLCRDLVDEWLTVTNEEVCAAIQLLWETQRCIPEPAGAMGLAGLLKEREARGPQKSLCVVCGSNMDFSQLAWISRHGGIGGGRRRYFRFEIPERPGGMLYLLDHAFEGVNIIEFQYGKQHADRAWPVIGIEAAPMQLDLVDQRLSQLNIEHQNVTSQADIEFRIINYKPDLIAHPVFIQLEFPERPGALHDFLTHIGGRANLCYFNYQFTGETVGRALLGFEFESPEEREAFRALLESSKHAYKIVDEDVLARIL
jgi:threonine dehydratase